jgi:precorrin-2 dehydrogenase/sirohydrochlorin ferrochelatase
MRLETEYTNLDAMIDLQDEVRSMLKEIEPVQEERSRALWNILQDDEIWGALASDYAKARTMAIERYLHA